ncbi:response regulator transcription factor [Variovorax saccharolyticus]|uniref:response regulator transcription factor n=1 Tax=Variovorax saccharolyticus TaxID=3053516 RepID=UPI002575786C|nr:response regulator transcription factor [Variovorax sp. J22R187]MDM0022293.1 response regulator transcription factor [Variovorax sp. J22R187]
MNRLPIRPLNVMVTYPDPIVCTGLVTALRQHEDLQIFVDGSDDATCRPVHIDIVIADYPNALRLIQEGRQSAHGKAAGPRILALTANDREADIRRAVQHGVHGYLLLGGSLVELVDAVRAVGNGARYLCPVAAQRMADSLAGAVLTLRENQVLRLVATGHCNKEIARHLAIELGTVKSHVSAIMTKLGAISRTQAASIAVNRGLVDEQKPTSFASFGPSARMLEARPQFA